MNRNNKIFILILSLILLLIIPIQGIAEDNAGTGDGSTKGKVEGKGFYRSGEWMYKVSIYVGLKYTVETDSSFYSNYPYYPWREFAASKELLWRYFYFGNDTQCHSSTKGYIMVSWVIIYEPIAIAHLKDGKTKLAFITTEYAIAQRDGSM